MKKKQFLYRLIIFCVLIVGCKNDDDRVVPPVSAENQVPGDFTIQVNEITANSALLEWTLAVDPNDDEVSYTIFLGENSIQSDVQTTEFLLEGLNAQTNYTGKVVASDGKGGTSENTFAFDTEDGIVISEEVSVAWKKSLGGSLDDQGHVIRQTNDGGYVIAGFSESNDGDVGNNKGKKDCWIVKLDESGNLVWETNLGGSDNETVHDIQQTTDGGFIVGAFSNSGDGDVGGNKGMRDFWIVKLDLSGSMEWETNYGGSSDDILESIMQTSDGGYVATGFTLSSNGDVSNNHGNGDAWIVKLDSSGSMEWEINYGGTGNDIAASIDQTTDQGFIVAGYTTTDENKRDVWVAKLDTEGNLDWQKTITGTDNEEAVSVQQTTDNGYVIGGYSDSADGDIGNNKGSADALVVKLDVSGNLLWQKTFGGSSLDAISEITQTTDGGYIAAGSSNSSDGDIETNNGASDFWVMKLDTSGTMVWQKNLGDEGDDYALSAQQTQDGGYVVAGSWYTNIMGSGEGTTGDFNYWVIKLE